MTYGFLFTAYRSGSTVFMRALAAGGMAVIREPYQKLFDAVEDMFLPEPGSEPREADPGPLRGMTGREVLKIRQAFSRHRFHEPSPEQMEHPDFPMNHPESAVKFVFEHGAPFRWIIDEFLHPDVRVRAVLLHRHPREIRVSMEDRLDWRKDLRREPGSMQGTLGPLLTRDDGRWYRAQMESVRSLLLADDRVEDLYEVQYAPNYRPDLPALLGDESEIFGALADRGWPIDPAAAAAMIDPGRRTVVAEDLPLKRAV